MTICKVADGVSCHAWSPDRKRIALCPNNEKILIYKNADQPDFSKWVLEHELLGHDLVVSALDWSPVHDKIVSCSHDRNAFVWTLTEGKWTCSLAILRISRAAIDVRWSPDGTKFAVASGAKVVPVCSYEEANDWWVSKIIKKHKSTVTSVAWHPNSQLLATGSTDFRCRIFCAFIDSVDQNKSTVFGNTADLHFGDPLFEIDAGGWVEGCAWSPNGNTLGYVSHDSAISFLNIETGSPTCDKVKITQLPGLQVLFLSDTAAVAVGHSFQPEFFQFNGGKWRHLGSCDQGLKKSASSGTHFSAARSLWANKTNRGTDKSESDKGLSTAHHGAITNIKAYNTSSAGKVSAFSTSGLDGHIVLWKDDAMRTVKGLTA